MSPIEIFCSYSHRDEALRDELEKHLSRLKRQGYISTWHDRRVAAGQKWAEEIDNHLNTAQIILLLISPDFLASDYCDSIEVKRAVERHERGEARVIPVILRMVDWQYAPLDKLQALPKDAKPVKSWSDQDEAFYDVTIGIRKVVVELRKKFSTEPTAADQSDISSNLVPTVVDNAAQTKQKTETSTTVPDKLTSNFIADSSSILNVSAVENRSVREVLPEHKTELSGSRSRILSGHLEEVMSVAISSDERTIVSGGNDRKIRVWDMGSGELQHTLEGHTGEIGSVAISMSGRMIVSGGGDKRVRIWDMETGEPLHILNRHKGLIRCVAISADEKIIASGGSDRIVSIWNLKTEELWGMLPGHENTVNSVAISKDGRTIVSGSHHAVKIWHWETEELPHTLGEHRSYVMSVAISVDGKTIVSGSYDKTIRIWNLETGKYLPFIGHEGIVRGVAISENGKTIVSGSSDQTVKVWDIKTGKLLRTLTGHKGSINGVAISRDGKTIVSGSDDRTVRIWNLDAEDIT